MRIIDTKIMTGDNHPQLRIMNKLYTVDDRKTTFAKVQKIQSNPEISQEEKEKAIFELTLGAEGAAEIMALDLSFQQFEYLTYCVFAAVTGKDPDMLQKEAEGKN